MSSHLDQTSLVHKGVIARKNNTIFLQDTAGNSELVRNRHLGSQSKHRILFTWSAHRTTCSPVINISLANLDYLHFSSSGKHISIMITKQKKSFHCPTNHWYCSLCPNLFNKLTSVFYASVLLLIKNFIITLSK